MSLLFGILFFCLSTALGCATLHAPRWLPGRRVPRFLVGFGATAWVLGGWTLLGTGVWPGVSPWVLLIAPLLWSGLVLLRRGRTSLARLRPRASEQTANWLVIASVLVAVAVVLMFSSKALHHTRRMLVQHDALVYAREALPFALARRWQAIPHYGAPLGKPTPGTTHSYLFQAYLALALMARPPGQAPGFPHDQALRLAFQLCQVGVFAAVAALAWELAPADGLAGLLAASLATPLLCLDPALILAAFYDSRDAFRVAPVCLLGAVLVPLLRRRVRGRGELRTLAMPSLLAGVSILAHTLDIVVVGCMLGIWWLFWVGSHRPRPTLIVQVSGLLALGPALAGVPFVRNWAQTGSWLGTRYQIFLHSPIRQAMLAPLQRVLRMTFLQRVIEVAVAHGAWLSGASIALGLATLLAYAAGWKPGRRLALGASWVLVSWLLPLTGWLDSPHQVVPLSTMMVGSFRYALHASALAAAWLGALGAYLATHVRRLAPLVLVPLMLLAGMRAAVNVSRWPGRAYYLGLGAPTFEIIRALRHIPRDQRVLLDVEGTAYYLRQPTCFLLSRPLWPLLKAPNVSTAEKILARDHIQWFVMQRNWSWWGSLPFGKAIARQRLVLRGHRWRLFRIDHVPSHR